MAKKLVPTPHDRFFRASMSNPRVAKEFFEDHLPAHIQALVNLDTLHFTNGTFVDKELALQMSDALFSVQRRDKKSAYLYCLVEHQSTPDPLMPFRTVKYTLEIMEQHHKEHKDLPIVYVLVLYHGDKKYPYSTDFFDLFGEDKALAQQILFKPFDLIDLTQISDEQLKKHRAWAGMLELTLKNAARQDLLLFVKNTIQQIQTIEAAYGIDYLTTAFKYMFSVGGVSNKKLFEKILHDNLSPQLEESAMTFAEHLKQEGRQESRQESRQAMQKIARYLLQTGAPESEISILTGLSQEEIRALERVKQTVH